VTNVPLVTRKLAIIDDHLRRIQERRPADIDSFKKNSILQDAIAMSVLVIVQEAMDVGLTPASARVDVVTPRGHSHEDEGYRCQAVQGSPLRVHSPREGWRDRLGH